MCAGSLKVIIRQWEIVLMIIMNGAIHTKSLENSNSQYGRLCANVRCEHSFLNTIRAIMVLSCDQCFSLNYSFCTSFKGSTNMTSLVFCDHNFPQKCQIEDDVTKYKSLDQISRVCYNNSTLSEPPDMELRDVNRHNFSIRIPNIRLRDYWNRLELISFKVRLFCPDAVCSKKFDNFANNTFLLREIDLFSKPDFSYDLVTVAWDSLEKTAKTGEDVQDEAVSLEYALAYNKTFLVNQSDYDVKIFNDSEYDYANSSRNGTFVAWSVQHMHSKPISVRYSITPETKLFNAGLVVLLVLVFVLFSGMLLACLARRHASNSLTTRYKKRAIDDARLAPMRSEEKLDLNFEEAYKLLPMPSRIGPEHNNIIDTNNATIIENKANFRNENSPATSSFISQKILPGNGPNFKVYADICQSNSIVIPHSDLDLLEIIGQGRFGLIKRGYVGQKNECMVHCAKAPYAITPEESKVFLEHLDSSIKARSHPNVISFIGVCGQGEDLYIAMQLENGQNLRNLLRESRCMENFMHFGKAHGKISLMSSQRLLSIMLGIARGMGYLEENNVLHDQLAAVNVIIGENGTPKIGNFGMAQLSDLYKRQNDKDHRTLRWMPPETLRDHLFSLKSQVWSFGVVLWEIITLGGMPYNELSDQEVLDQVLEGYRLKKPANVSIVLYTLMNTMCWNGDADCRPNFHEILRHLHDLNLNPEDHINLNRTEYFTYERTWLLRA